MCLVLSGLEEEVLSEVNGESDMLKMTGRASTDVETTKRKEDLNSALIVCCLKSC